MPTIEIPDISAVRRIQYADLKHPDSGAVLVCCNGFRSSSERAEHIVARLSNQIRFARFDATAFGPALICRGEASHPCPIWINADRVTCFKPCGAVSAPLLDGCGWDYVSEDMATTAEKLVAAR